MGVSPMQCGHEKSILESVGASSSLYDGVSANLGHGQDARGTHGRDARATGLVLVIVLVVVAMMSMIAAGVMYQARAEISASTASASRHQAKATAMSGIMYTAAVLKHSINDPDVWLDNPTLFQNQFVCEVGGERWYFSIYAPNPPEHKKPRFGVIDEAAKLSVNTAGEQAIKKLLSREKNGDELADCLLDWINPLDEPRPLGAGQEYYDSLSTPYRMKRGPLTTIEELLCIKGFTAMNVYGNDANLNGILDPNEDDGDDSFPPDKADGKLDMGLRGLMTVGTWEPRPMDKIDLNRLRPNDVANQLGDIGLSDDTILFIRIYRAENSTFTHASQLLEMTYTLKNDFQVAEGNTLAKDTVLQSGVGAEQLPLVMDKLIAVPGGGRGGGRGGGGMVLVGLLNVNSACAEVLAAVTNDDAVGKKIADTRESLSPEQKSNTAWLHTEGLLDADQYKAIAPRLTTRSYQFRIMCVGFAHPSGRYCILEATLDLSRINPRITYIRDITRLGMPFATDVEKERENR